jgi:hypothetical protein
MLDFRRIDRRVSSTGFYPSWHRGDPHEKGSRGLCRHEMHIRACERQLRIRIPGIISPSRPEPSYSLAVFAIPQLHFPNRLSGSAPDALEETILLCEPVEAVVALAHGADEAAEGVDLVVARVAAVLVNLADADLDGSVVLGLDDASGGRLGGISIALRESIGALAGTHAFTGDVNCKTS